MLRTPPFTVEGYRMLNVIGEGTAGTVFLARGNQTTTDVAIKVIPSSKVHAAVRREVSIHIQQEHPNILPLHSATYARIPHAPPALALVMPHAPGEDMFAEVAASGCLSPRVLRRRLKDIASALNHLHQQGIVHLDVKLENVVISASSTAQLIDFGCARHITGKIDSRTPLGGTLQYIPPEVVEDPSSPPATTSDAWALGVLGYTAIAGSYPFNGTTPGATDTENDRATRRRICAAHPHRLPSSIDLPSDLRRIIFGLLEKDPAKRMTIPQVIAELESSMSSIVSRVRIPHRPKVKSANSHTACPGRPGSPPGITEANFDLGPCQEKQTPEDALLIVDSIQQSRAKAAEGVRMYMSEMGAEARKSQYSASTAHRPHPDKRTQ